MVNPYMKAPHTEPGRPISPDAPNAALLIDFDNVTMGMRSDLAKELKNLLDSDIIKGKVTVQRAYSDWRRYPQYIVPLSEASIDLIFAPAYGSSKKNATDIRMAIGRNRTRLHPSRDRDLHPPHRRLRLLQPRPEAQGERKVRDRDRHSGVQFGHPGPDCDEYYSYTAVTGLSRASEDGTTTPDAWECVEEAVGRMVSRGGRDALRPAQAGHDGVGPRLRRAQPRVQDLLEVSARSGEEGVGGD